MNENVQEKEPEPPSSLYKSKSELSAKKSSIFKRHSGQKKSSRSGKDVKTHSKKWHSLKKGKRPHRLKAPLLRPVGAQVPCAPLNSTQFIMDDHENSTLFVHFQSNEMLKNIEYQGDACDGSSPFQPTDWLPYNMADFEWAYRTAKEDRMMNANVSDVRKAILGLEAKVSVVTELLEASPSRILSRLQEHLLKLQEENSNLRQKKLHYEHCKKSTSSSSTSSSSSSSNTTTSNSSSSSSEGSDSECSNPECETCISRGSEDCEMEGQHAKQISEEEKENTCPSASHHEERSDPVPDIAME